MTRAEHVRALLAEYAQQRALDEREQQARLDAAVARVPEIGQLRQESADLAFGAMRGILGETDAARRQAMAQEMKARGRAINARIRRLLVEAGMPADALETRYRCPVCKDTGYVGDAPARFCDCFEQRLRLRQHEDGSMAGLGEQNFERFNAAVAPEEGGQREQLVKARSLCERYADSFPDTDFRNLVLTGEGGLGKTFLLNCVFERVTSRGFTAVRITAFRMFEAMRQQHMGNDEKYDGFSALIGVPLLLIDDLGTEPMMRNITLEYLFTLLNERIAAKRHTVVATNLTAAQLKERYGERVASRLLDRSLCAAVLFRGKDLRRL
ncbi:MAG: ATP-binding protein [Clostridia bacterium]|nr:ATP-binding protein [Clostridia bacterium]MBR3273673.1 ATP-binding protein [Clostridia bacterium]